MTTVAAIAPAVYRVEPRQPARPGVWFVAPDRTRFPLSPSDPGAGVGMEAAAAAILFHATGDLTVADLLDHAFMIDHLTAPVSAPGIEVTAATVAGWLADHGVDTTQPWGPAHRAPRVEHAAGPGHPQRYTVSLDRWDLLLIDLHPDQRRARVAVTDLRARRECRFDATVTLAPARDGGPRGDGERVTVEEMPFGGWAVHIDGSDLAIIDRDPTRADLAQLAIYDHHTGDQTVAFDATLRYRQLPTTAAQLNAAERLRRFSQAATIPGTHHARGLQR